MNSKAKRLLAVTICFCFSMTVPAHAQPRRGTERQEPRLITVMGEAQVLVVPDEVILNLGVDTFDPDIEVAKRLNDTRVQEVLAVARKHGIEARGIQTDRISIESRYDGGSYGQRRLLGYSVSRAILFTLKDISRFEDLFSDVLKAGSNRVHGIEFRTTELRKHRDQARSLAIRAARDKAVALSGELGQKIGRPYSINEDQSGWYSPYGRWWGRGAAGGGQVGVQAPGGGADLADGLLAPGQITVSARVTVSFELQ